MTPTEQDKELREALYTLLKTDPRADTPYLVMDIIVDFITADRKRVALEARKDQTFKVIQSLVKGGSISDSSASRALTLFDIQLKAQQEEL